MRFHPRCLSASRLSRSLIGTFFLFLLSTSAGAQPDVPQRLTFNTVEDRTTSGSIAHDCDISVAVWMQEQTGPGWNLVWSENFGVGWTDPLPLETAEHEDYAPSIMQTWSDPHARAVWQRGIGTAAEIMQGEKEYGGGWSVEAITSNGMEDLSPDIAAGFNGRVHVTWVGYDLKSGAGKIFYASKVASPPGPWTIEILAESELGPFWTGAAPKIDISENDDVVHIVYRGGDFGQYHTHYARRDAQGMWSFQILTSLNQEDLLADVTGRSPSDEMGIVMSGNDCFGCPSRIYLRRSFDLGLTFGSAELVSGSRSAELGSISGGSVDIAVVAAELSGNILTGELVLSREIENFVPEVLPPANLSSSSPSVSQVTCVGRGPYTFFGLGVAFTNRGGELAPADSAEVWAIEGHSPGLAINDVSPSPGAGLSVTAVPNPFSRSTVLTATSLLPSSPVELNIYDSLGRLVKRFGDIAPASNFSWSWDGRDASGRYAPAGIFFVVTKHGGEQAIERLTLIR